MLRLSVFNLFIAMSWQASAATKWLNPGEKSGIYAPNPQYENYKDKIKTPLRQLKVPSDFSLIDDFESFIAWHDEFTTGQFPDTIDWLAQLTEKNIDVERCNDDAKQLSTTTALENAAENSWFNHNNVKYEFVQAQTLCANALAQKFMNNPTVGVAAYAEILKYWQKNNILSSINETTKRVPTANSSRTSFTYATRSRVGHSLAHYAVYHRLYGLNQKEHNLIDEMFSEFVKNYDYYYAFKTSEPFLKNLCQLDKRATVPPDTTNDHCGSAALRLAVGATLYGLEFNNQIVFDFGIQLVEIALATFDENKAYTAQIFRGMLALGYARQIISELDKLDYAFEKAFGLNFSEMPTPHGPTPQDVYLEMLNFASNPIKLADYFKTNGYGFDGRGGDFEENIEKYREGEIENTVFWEAFNLRDYYLLGGKMAFENFNKEFRHFLKTSPADSKWGIQGSINVGINNLVLRQATGQLPTLHKAAKDKAPIDVLEDKSGSPPANFLKLSWFIQLIGDEKAVLEAEDFYFIEKSGDSEASSLKVIGSEFNHLTGAAENHGRENLNLTINDDMIFTLKGKIEVFEGEFAQIGLQSALGSGQRTFFFGPGDSLILKWEHMVE